jgi:hypothetical protein
VNDSTTARTNDGIHTTVADRREAATYEAGLTDKATGIAASAEANATEAAGIAITNSSTAPDRQSNGSRRISNTSHTHTANRSRSGIHRWQRSLYGLLDGLDRLLRDNRRRLHHGLDRLRGNNRCLLLNGLDRLHALQWSLHGLELQRRASTASVLGISQTRHRHDQTDSDQNPEKSHDVLLL